MKIQATIKAPLTRLVLNIVGMMMIFVLVLFLPGGTLDWIAGWTFLSFDVRLAHTEMPM